MQFLELFLSSLFIALMFTNIIFCGKKFSKNPRWRLESKVLVKPKSWFNMPSIHTKALNNAKRLKTLRAMN
jgi:hypothetical protein